MNNFIYFGSAKISTVINDYTDRIVEAGANWECISSTLIPRSIADSAELSTLRKHMVQSACAVSF